MVITSLIIQSMDPGWEPGAQMVAGNRVVAGMDSSRRGLEAVDTPSHTVAGPQDTSQPVLVVEEVSLDLPPFAPQTHGDAYTPVYQIRTQYTIQLLWQTLQAGLSL
jgi:hypothetical protein